MLLVNDKAETKCCAISIQQSVPENIIFVSGEEYSYQGVDIINKFNA